MKKYFITGIGTDSGKTVISAMIAQSLGADYWKPIQAGKPTDSDFIKENTQGIKIHPEGILLEHPMSPHAAADLENRQIGLNDLKLPTTSNSLIIEGAGGLMVPVNDSELVIDIAKKFDLEVILVSRNYLGSINHTLLSIEYLKNYGFNIKGIVFNGKRNPSTEGYILKHSGLTCLFKVEELNKIDVSTIKQVASTVRL